MKSREITTKERILDASRELFIKNGVRNVTMSDIAVHLGMSKRTIYENVKNKGELIAGCIDYFELMSEAQFDKLNKNIKMITLIKLFIEYSSRIVDSDLGTFFYEVKKYHPDVFVETVKKYKDKRVARIIELTEKGVAEGFFIKRANAQTMGILMSGILEGLEENNLHRVEKKQLPILVRDTTIIFCRGLATQRGIEEMDRVFKIE